MNISLVAAALLAFLVGLAHSLLGERWVFSRMRRGCLVPTDGGTLLRERHVRIIWASWHVLTVLGWAMACALLLLAAEPTLTPHQVGWLRVVALAMLAAAGIVLVGTRARHPGWLGLLGVAGLTWLGGTLDR